MDKQDSGGVIICLPDARGQKVWEQLHLKIFIFSPLAPVQILTNNFEMLKTEVKQASRSISTRSP